MLCVFNGVISDPKIKTNIIPNIEHSKLAKVNAIILHRTSASTVESTLNAWKTKNTGAHFLIAKDGTIYQTAAINKRCWHVGLLRSRCRIEDSCSEKDTEIIKKALHSSGSWKSKFKKVYQHEKTKDYPDRYPLNSDSIGVEIIGAYLGKSGDKGLFEQIQKAQSKSFLWLMTELLEHFSLSFKDDVYAHDSIARKKVNEGVKASQLLQEYCQ
ncbi:peptidoglycan recognition protein family protein [Kangiella shandongensis]|uniref:peptidoglycan recognition protein family protein n=1 Tax=Kangiella shandongensis TaxID=2763258 RepID=UPI001CBAA34F|nr:peptidoglycan recognition family protein [Kangiella shandongensis]